MSLKSVSKADPNFVPNYQLSGIPFLTSSMSNEVGNTPIQIQFPYVTKSVTIHNTGGNDLRFGFTRHGLLGTETNNYFVLHAHNTNKDDPALTLDVRCKEMWFTGPQNSSTTSFSLYAALTPISTGSFPTLTGSNGFEGIG